MLSFTSLNTHGRHQLSQEEFTVYNCLNCGSYYLPHPKTTKEYYQKYYPKNYYPQPNQLVRLLNKFSFSAKRHLINKHHPNIQILLDIGCGQGEFLDSLPNSISKYGNELNPQAKKICHKKGIKMVDLKTPENYGFDCITLWHVLEHTPNPAKFLTQASRFLNQNGIIVMAVPNNSSLGFRAGRAHYFHLDSPRHLFIPSLQTISYLAHIAGLKLVDIKNPWYDYPLDLFWSLIHHPTFLLSLPLYPLLKLYSSETLIVVLKKF